MLVRCIIYVMTHPDANVISTGYYHPTFGTAYVNGCDLVHDLMGVRASIGYCAQNPVFYRYLTVENHLRLFGMVSINITKVIITLPDDGSYYENNMASIKLMYAHILCVVCKEYTLLV